jgi:thiopurine S-methyltransferase
MESILNENYWDQRYQNNETGWDIGTISTPLKDYIDQLKDKSIKILIPGCGNAHEAEYLYNSGFTNVYVIDLSKIPLDNFSSRVPEFPKSHLIQGYLFDYTGQFDLILEQTIFCAIEPKLRNAYAKKAAELLTQNGKLTGVLFNREFVGGPPFGGNIDEYKNCFSLYFSNVSVEPCYNSITPRKGSEVFIICKK